MAEPSRSLITWEDFQNFLDPSIPGIHRILGEPPADLFIDSGGKRIGLRIPVLEHDAISHTQLTEVDSEIVTIAGQRTLQISTTSKELFRDFLSFAQSVADQVQLEGKSPISSVFNTLERWRELLSIASIMSEERQVGLWGELWVLRQLIGSLGNDSVSSWTGPSRELHDFRLSSHEFEVKTTRGQRRIHLINGLNQLSPSPKHALYLISIMIRLSGDAPGVSLPDWVEQIREILPQDSHQRSQFETKLAETGYRYQDVLAYENRYHLGDRVMVIPVDSRFPKISRGNLDSILGDESHRVDDVQYRVDVEGKGVPTSDPAYSHWFAEEAIP